MIVGNAPGRRLDGARRDLRAAGASRQVVEVVCVVCRGSAGACDEPEACTGDCGQDADPGALATVT